MLARGERVSARCGLWTQRTHAARALTFGGVQKRSARVADAMQRRSSRLVCTVPTHSGVHPATHDDQHPAALELWSHITLPTLVSRLCFQSRTYQNVLLVWICHSSPPSSFLVVCTNEALSYLAIAVSRTWLIQTDVCARFWQSRTYLTRFLAVRSNWSGDIVRVNSDSEALLQAWFIDVSNKPLQTNHHFPPSMPREVVTVSLGQCGNQSA